MQADEISALRERLIAAEKKNADYQAMKTRFEMQQATQEALIREIDHLRWLLQKTELELIAPDEGHKNCVDEPCELHRRILAKLGRLDARARIEPPVDATV